MKKMKVLLVATIISLPLLITTCSEDNPVNCTELALEYTEASLDYYAEPSTDNCVALKDAIEEYLDSDCRTLDGASRDELQLELEALPCN